ncbi:unnamed protein product [Moneuplotes crassus]|uniref:Uncharacterized protein n=1 Tax=Euplotes crassus TaxID=5936 RepID=A0AAD1X557_EUPCR|nr:unnamed protein product [Moneuplotes crassus]
MGRSVPRALIANCSFIFGILGGVKAADWLLWDAKKYDGMKEQMEIDYWKKYGRPTEIEGNLQKSTINEGEYYITYLKDKNKHKYMHEIYKMY